MNEALELVACGLCGADAEIELYGALRSGETINDTAFLCTNNQYQDHLRIVACGACGHVYANPVWKREILETQYTNVVDRQYVGEESGRAMTFQRRLRFMDTLGDWRSLGRLVDVGAYTGVFVEEASKWGYHSLGVEPSAWGVAQGRARGVEMIQGLWGEVDLGETPVGVVSMWDVIEHVRDPMGMIRAAWEVLEPGGLLIVHTVDRESVLARLMGESWPWYMDMHIQYFSKSSLERCVYDTGFEILWSGAEGRMIRGTYLISRLEGMRPWLGVVAKPVIYGLGLAERMVPVNLGDLVSVYATKVAV